ncbi:Transcriptional regulator YqjI [Nocardia otitidiscaviarum]|uniref:Transcriptional regulator YqjI n=3 Tax=Nocardia otitidiscaviarum TaxID=1823 RepID=A0A378YUS3_9NOCA|nr:PadR family transcriptional regulator [Nocardia otitidiscaviarum]SUA80925.1 Transcriptional regulator YqjI [Nocardia otitidiscaviarum]
MEHMDNTHGARGPWRRMRRDQQRGPDHPRMGRGPHGGPGGPHRHGHGRGFGDFGPGFGPGGFGPGFGPGPHFGRGRGRGGRGRRGDVRAAILLLLQERPMHGYELIQQIRERSEDVWRPSPGSIYPALAQLEDEGLVIIEKVSGRKTAKLTEAGTAYVEEHRSDLGDPWQEVKDGVGDQTLDLRGLVGQLMGAVAQVAAVGTPAQAAKAAEVLTEARKSLYRILAEDDTPEK